MLKENVSEKGPKGTLQSPWKNMVSSQWETYFLIPHPQNSFLVRPLKNPYSPRPFQGRE